jgi:flagellar hook-length control protein FliK
VGIDRGEDRGKVPPAITPPAVGGSASAHVSAPPGAGAAPRVSTPAEALDQAVAHARLNDAGSAPEIEIRLRPESLGHLRMRVSTENRRVTVRILAERAAAAGIMEGQVERLRADLAAAGLEMDRFEVAVAQGGADPAGGAPAAAGTGSGEPLPPAPDDAARERIDFFA